MPSERDDIRAILANELRERFARPSSLSAEASSEGPRLTTRSLSFSEEVAARVAARECDHAEYWPNRAEQLRRQRDEALASLDTERDVSGNLANAVAEQEERLGSEMWTHEGTKLALKRAERMRPILWAMGCVIVAEFGLILWLSGR